MTSPAPTVPAPCLTFELGGLPVRLFTEDARIRDRSREGFRRWCGRTGTRVPPLDLHVRPSVRLPERRNIRTRVRYRIPSDGTSPEIIASRFRIRTDPSALRMESEVDAAHGLGDFYRMAIGAAVLARGGFLIHAAALEMPDGSAHLFCGPSGFGKTTLARSVPRNAVLADDTVAVWTVGEQAYASPTPFFGDYGRPPLSLRPHPRRVSRIYLLAPHRNVNRLGARKPRGTVDLFRFQTPNPKPGTPNRIEAVSPAAAAAAVASQIIAPASPPAATQQRMLDTVSALAMRVPAFRLSYTPGPEVWPFLKTALRRDLPQSHQDTKGSQRTE